MRDVNDVLREGRWVHPCWRGGAVFGVLAPHDCPICGERCPDSFRDWVFERDRRAVVENQAAD